MIIIIELLFIIQIIIGLVGIEYYLELRVLTVIYSIIMIYRNRLTNGTIKLTECIAFMSHYLKK